MTRHTTPKTEKISSFAVGPVAQLLLNGRCNALCVFCFKDFQQARAL